MASSLTITEAEKIIANYAFFFLDDCANWAESAVVFYEYVITFDNEVRLVWRRKITGASVIFFLNRYLLVLQSVITVTSYWPVSNPVRLLTLCRVLGWLDLLFNVFPYFVWNVFSTLRVYALSGRDWRLASLVCLLMAGSVVANVYNLPTQRPDNMPPPYNCEVDNALTVAQHTILVLLSRCTLIAGDATVLGVTWWKTWSIKKAADAARISTSLVDLLLRDGTIYFGAMLLLNVLHILVNSVEKVSFLGDIAHVLTSVLVSRFIMNLRDAGGRGSSTDAVSAGGAGVLETWHAERGTAGGGTLVFASNFVESLGGPLDRGGVDDSDPGMLPAQAEAPVESGGAKVAV